MRAIIVMALFVALISPVSASLITYYPFDGNAKDLSGNDNHGKMFGGRFVDGIAGKGIYLDGMGDYVQVVDSPSFHDLKRLSIDVWIKTSKTPGTIVSKEFNGVYSGFELRIDPEGQVEFRVGREQAYSPAGIASRAKINDGNWHRITAVYRGDVMRIYIDGNLDVSLSTTRLVKLDNNRPLIIGKTIYSGGKEFKGIIDELKIYDHALTYSEIQKTGVKNQPTESETPESSETPLQSLNPPETSGASETPPAVEFNPDKFRIFLDVKVEKIDEVVMGTTTYGVYRFVNVIPYASRIEVISGDGRIEDRDVAEQILKSVVSEDPSYQHEDLIKEWNNGRKAEQKVYVTVLGIPLIIIGALIFLRVRKNSSDGKASPDKGYMPADVAEFKRLSKMIANLEIGKEKKEIDEEVYSDLKEEYEKKLAIVIRKMEENLKRSMKESELLVKEIEKINRELMKLRGRFTAGELSKRSYEKKKRELEKQISLREEKKKFLNIAVSQRTKILKIWKDKKE